MVIHFHLPRVEERVSEWGMKIWRGTWKPSHDLCWQVMQYYGCAMLSWPTGFAGTPLTWQILIHLVADVPWQTAMNMFDHATLLAQLFITRPLVSSIVARDPVTDETLQRRLWKGLPRQPRNHRGYAYAGCRGTPTPLINCDSGIITSAMFEICFDICFCLM